MTDKKEERNEYARETYRFLKKRGYCVKCGKEKAFYNHVMCPFCIEKDSLRSQNKTETQDQKEKRNDRRRTAYYDRKENGLCVRCGKKEATVGTTCLECYVKHKRSRDDWRRRSGTVKGYAEAGLCIRCGAVPEAGRNLCPFCLQKQRESAEYARGFIPRQLRIESF